MNNSADMLTDIIVNLQQEYNRLIAWKKRLPEAAPVNPNTLNDVLTNIHEASSSLADVVISFLMAHDIPNYLGNKE
ncbi:MAG: hypothetical protein IKT59_09025 [Bacteroidales bacterium]|nr:hypothetical protein [Bacteroidales bacterium]